MILNGIADGVFTIDANWRIESFNAAAETITGFTAEEAIGKVCREIFRTNICDYDCAIRRALATNEPVTNYEVVISHKDGMKLPVSVSASILRDEEGNVIGAVETFRDISQIRWLTTQLQERYHFENIIGKSNAMVEIYDLIETVSQNDINILVQGETGTGKGLVAKAIHYHSPRADKPFVTVNCAALPEALLESELFGHVKGSFTSAIADKPGRFELANGGTIFLDEIGEIPSAIQAKLLRVTDDKEFERVGGTKTIKVDVRIVAATNRDLRDEVKQRQFREDLFYRLNVFTIEIPPLRERREDIPLLIQYFIAKYNEEFTKEIEGVSQSAMDLMLSYDWSGSVRELENAVEHAFVQCGSKLIMPEHLPEAIKKTSSYAGISAPLEPTSSENPLEAAEKTVILRVLEETRWNIGKTAQILKLSRPTLWRKMKKYEISKPG